MKEPAPISSLPEATARSLLGVVFDVDDTVTEGGRLTSAALESMYRLRNNGLGLVAATGRPLGWAEVIASQWPVDAAVGENGAGYRFRIGRGLSGALLCSEEALEDRRPSMEALAEEILRAVPGAKLADDQALRICDLAFDIGETQRLSEAAVRIMRERIAAAGMRSTLSSVHLHATPFAFDKARGALEAIRASLGGEAADTSRWLFVGDSPNDAEAFATFPSSVGVANVRPHLPKLPRPPRYLTRLPRGEGFRELTEVLLGLRG